MRKIRKEKMLSFRDLSKLTGVSFSYLCKLENGKAKNPREGIKILIAKGLKVKICDLFF